MSGFLNNELNIIARKDIFNRIIKTIEYCCYKMENDYTLTNEKIKNDERAIQNILYNKYIMNHEIKKKFGWFNFPIVFIIESPENYIEEKNTYLGRTDIKILSSNYVLNKNKNDYYIIECKRIDGSKTLNNEYLLNGVARFISSPIKYKSPNKKNALLGFVVKKINITENTNLISINNEKFFGTDISKITSSDDTKLFKYSSKYKTDNDYINLTHLFYDLSSIIKI